MPTIATEADFSTFVDTVIAHEGGAKFVNHPLDPGGATKWGISLSLARYDLARFDLDGDGDVDADDIRILTREDAVVAYRDVFWRPTRAAELPLYLALPVFDMAVNQGQRAAIRCLQRAVGASADGIIGPNTIRQALVRNDHERVAAEFLARRCKKYAEIRTVGTFGLGWMRRAVAIDRDTLALIGR